jgi:hypothetical protein
MVGAKTNMSMVTKRRSAMAPKSRLTEYLEKNSSEGSENLIFTNAQQIYEADFAYNKFFAFFKLFLKTFITWIDIISFIFLIFFYIENEGIGSIILVFYTIGILVVEEYVPTLMEWKIAFIYLVFLILSKYFLILIFPEDDSYLKVFINSINFYLKQMQIFFGKSNYVAYEL